MRVVTAVHFYVTDLDAGVDFYTRLLGSGPKAAYDESPTAQSAFFVIEDHTCLILTCDPERGRESGGSVRLELSVADLDAEVERLRGQGVEGGRRVHTRFGTEVFDIADPDGHLIRIGPAWTLHAIEGAV